MNRYIKAMEIGLENEQDGISYFNLISILQESQGYPFGRESELSFLAWFAKNFSRSDRKIGQDDFNRYRHLLEFDSEVDPPEHVKVKVIQVRRLLNYKYWLDGNAAKQYLDYLELKESRIAATQARKQSNYSIWISIGAVVISSLLGAYSIYSTPAMPYDVNIVEDNTRINELENEMKVLQKKLSNADLLIDMYESDSIQ